MPLVISPTLDKIQVFSAVAGYYILPRPSGYGVHPGLMEVSIASPLNGCFKWNQESGMPSSWAPPAPSPCPLDPCSSDIFSFLFPISGIERPRHPVISGLGGISDHPCPQKSSQSQSQSQQPDSEGRYVRELDLIDPPDTIIQTSPGIPRHLQASKAL